MRRGNQGWPQTGQPDQRISDVWARVVYRRDRVVGVVVVVVVTYT